jgi:succinylarginine dihydrolase
MMAAHEELSGAAAQEVNFDGLVGPTHNYAGLAYGNVAAMGHRLTESNPLSAVLQGLEKMKLLADLGVKQAVLPPHERPHIRTLRRLGFRGSDAAAVATAARDAPEILAACYSSSGMWTANAATVSPSADTSDGRVHITPANLVSHFHRSIESQFTAFVMQRIFPDESLFAHHAAVPSATHFSDEGAANHTRLCGAHGERGIEVFVFGRQAFPWDDQSPTRFPARQTLEASRAIARLHLLDPMRTLFARQNPVAIDAGVFHNDVIAVGNENVFFYHSEAFSDSSLVTSALKERFDEICGRELILIEVTADQVSLDEAVRSYLFNSQLVTLKDGSMCMLAPQECAERYDTRNMLEGLLSQPNPIQKVAYVDLRQSMKNGGGPACLRLRIVLTPPELERSHRTVFFDDRLHGELVSWAMRHYRDRLHPDDLIDPSLLEESRSCLDELTHILEMGSIYDFQKSAG